MARLPARVAIGRTRGGRWLRVIDVPDPKPDSVFVVTAYEVTGKPVKLVPKVRESIAKQRRCGGAA